MTQIEVNPKLYQRLKQLSKEKKQSIEDVLTALLDENLESITSQPEESPLSMDEVQLLLQTQQPRTGKQIADTGVLGTWSDQNIADSLEWVEANRKKRRNKHQW